MSSSTLDRDDIQAKAFTNWVNYWLSRRQLSIDNIFNGFSNGFMLINFIEILWNESIGQKYEANPRMSFKKTQNIQMGLDFLIKKKVKIIGVDANDIESGSKSAILSLMCSIFNGYIDHVKFDGKEGKKGLLKWVKEVTHKCKGVDVSSLKSTYNELSFCAIISHFHPDAINYDQLNPNDSTNNSKALINAYTKLGIHPYLDETELVNLKDEVVIMLLYLQLYEFEEHPSSQFTLKESHESKEKSLPCIEKHKKKKDEKNRIALFAPGNRIKPQFASSNFEKIRVQESSMKNINLAFYINKAYGNPDDTIQRKPELVAKINDDTHEVEFYEDKLTTILKLAGTRPIISIAGIGGFQDGKSTTLCGFTGNLGYEVGNGNKETTKGVYVDGPYDIDYFYKRFNVTQRENIIFQNNEDLKPVIFFFDIEGYGGNMHSDDKDDIKKASEKNYQLYKKLCSPFACISSVFFLIAQPNFKLDDVKTIVETLSINKLSTNDEFDGNGAVRLVVGIKNCTYPPFVSATSEKELINVINEENINNAAIQISNQSQNSKEFEENGIKATFSPLVSPYPIMLIQGYVKSFGFFARDLIRAIEVASDGYFARDAERDINLFKFISKNYENLNFETMLKNKIFEEHEESLQNISQRLAYEASQTFMEYIDKQYELNEEHLDVFKDIQSVSDAIRGMGTNLIKEKLRMVGDSPIVAKTIEKYYAFISEYLTKKQAHLKEVREKYFEEQQIKATEFADEKLNEEIPKSKETIHKILQQNNYFNFDVKLIEEPVKQEAQKFSKYLYDELSKLVEKSIQEKQIVDDNYRKKMLDQKMADLDKAVISNEYNAFYNKLLAISKDLMVQEQKNKDVKGENKEEIEKKQLEAHNENENAIARHMIVTKADQQLNILFAILEEREVDDLKKKLEDKEFYLQNYSPENQTKLKVKINESIYRNMMDERNDIIDEIFDNYLKQHNAHINGITRVVNNEKESLIPKEKIDTIVALKAPTIAQDIRNCIYEARTNLTVIEYEKQNFDDENDRHIIIVKTRRVLYLPEGNKYEEDWEEARRKPRQFKIKIGKTRGKIVKISKKEFEHEHELGSGK